MIDLMVQVPQDKSRPPEIFHWVPWIGSSSDSPGLTNAGSAVSYGMDPYKFMFDNRDKARLEVERHH